MARIRSIHPGLFTDDAFATVSPLARLLWIGIWTEADDQGTFEWKPITFKMRLLPVDNTDVSALLAELEGANMIRRYSSGGREYGAVRNFSRFQRPKKPNSVHPLPAELRTYLGSSALGSEPDDDEDGVSSPPQPPQPPPVPQKGEISPQMEDGGWRMEDVKEPPSLRSGPPSAEIADAKPRKVIGDLKAEDFADWAAENAPMIDIGQELAKAQDWTKANGRRHKDAAAFVRNWMRKASADLVAGRGPLRNGHAPPQSPKTIFDLPEGDYAHEVFGRIARKRTGKEAAALRERFFADPVGTLPAIRAVDREMRGEGGSGVAERSSGAGA